MRKELRETIKQVTYERRTKNDMNIKNIVKILDEYTTPNLKCVEFPYYDSVARDILKELDKDDRIFTIDDMISFAFYVRSITNDIDWIFLNENHVKDFQKQQVESKYYMEIS